MKCACIAFVLAIFASCAHSGSAHPIGKFGWWTVFLSDDPATRKKTCAAEYVGGGMKLTASSLSISYMPSISPSWANSLEIAFDDEPLPRPSRENGMTQHFGVLIFEGLAFAKAMASSQLSISVGAVDLRWDMRGANQALQLVQNDCQVETGTR